MQANDYGGQLYLYDLDNRRARSRSPVDFRPDVGWSHWSRHDGHIYARTTDTQYSNIYRYDPSAATGRRSTPGWSTPTQFALARDGRRRPWPAAPAPRRPTGCTRST